MTIYTAFIPDQYCVYHTTYSGNLMPANYIGSSSVDNVLNQNYHGSVSSKRYKPIWLSELQLHPELFSTVIVSFHDTRSNATYRELHLQKTLNVVKSELFINRSYAKVNGFGDTTYTLEEKASTSKKMSDTHANKTPKEKASKELKRLDALANRTSEEKTATALKNAETYANKTPEEKTTSTNKRSASMMGKYKNPSVESRTKMSDAKKNIPKSIEHKANISAACKGKPKSPRSSEHTAKILTTKANKKAELILQQAKIVQELNGLYPHYI